MGTLSAAMRRRLLAELERRRLSARIGLRARLGPRLTALTRSPPTPPHDGPLILDAHGRASGTAAPDLIMGPYTFAQETPRVVRYPNDPDDPVTIGGYGAIAANVEFVVGGNHRVDWVSTFAFRHVLGLPGAATDGCPQSAGPIVVGSDVWIGRDALILSGVTIGHGAVIGARTVVAKDVRPYAIVVGNPAREVRRRFSDAQVEALLASEWWTWPPAEVLSIVDLLNGAGVDEFLAYAAARGERAP